MKRMLSALALVLVLTCGTIVRADGPGEGGNAPTGTGEGSDVVAVLIVEAASFINSVVP